MIAVEEVATWNGGGCVYVVDGLSKSTARVTCPSSSLGGFTVMVWPAFRYMGMSCSFSLGRVGLAGLTADELAFELHSLQQLLKESLMQHDREASRKEAGREVRSKK